MSLRMVCEIVRVWPAARLDGDLAGLEQQSKFLRDAVGGEKVPTAP